MSSKTNRPNRRRRMFVDVRIQGGMIRRILLHWLTFLLVSTLVASLLHLFTNPTDGFSFQLGSLFASVGPFVVTMLAMLPIFVIDTIKLTNKFAGPYVRYREIVRKAIRGEDVCHITFRKGDYWCESEADFNALFQELRDLQAAVAYYRAETADDIESAAPAHV